ncbi:monocarboxylate transporter 7-like isoform X2 [Varroa jacobsoni]|uniref:Monocarboxylate transporter n=1 Tax=Varroa destructor TaxID=109461 RepID=A0A7M7KI50_VARDE|nr:monocarboxylate transporter 7-like isoform X2 [Varroa destructor]XP_022693502.1 monocarboxylate transporter 7-like isoform X2 [Varroa jacobsoni]
MVTSNRDDLTPNDYPVSRPIPASNHEPDTQKQKSKKGGPDSWEGWRMVIYCFTNTFLVGGCTRSAAVLYVAVMDTFHVERGEAAWPISLISGFLSFAGILSGPLSTRFGLRITCVIGGCMSVVCLGACYFANNIVQLTVLFGILNAMIFPKFTELLYDDFGLHGLFLIFAGIMLITPIMSSLMRQPSWRKTKMRAPSIDQEIVRRFTISSHGRTSPVATMTQRSRIDTGTGESPRTRSRSATTLSQIGNRTRTTSINIMGINIGTRGKNDPDLVFATDIGTGALPHNTSENELAEVTLSNLDNVNAREEKNPHRDQPPLPSPDVHTLSAAIDAGKDAELAQVSEALEKERQLSLREIFCNPLFYLMIISYIVFTTYTDILFLVMIDLFTDKGIDQSTAIGTIPFVSVTDMLGRLILPFLVDKGFIDRKVVFVVNYFCLGGLACIIPSFREYSVLTCLFVLVGWFYGSTVVMCTIIVSDILGIHNLAVANGLICSTVGFIAFGRPTFIGYFRDTVGSYDPMLYFWSALLFTMAVVWSVIVIAVRRQDAKQKT